MGGSNPWAKILNFIDRRKIGSGEIAQWLRVLALVEDLGLVPFSGLHGYQAHTWHTYMQANS